MHEAALAEDAMMPLHKPHGKLRDGVIGRRCYLGLQKHTAEGADTCSRITR